MSSMAAEIQNRMREDGIDPNQRFAPDSADGPVPMVDVPPPVTPDNAGSARAREDEAPVPGSDRGAVHTDAPAPSAGTQNTDTPAPGEPGPIPYARFKEVNDRYATLKDFEQLAEYGYTSDHLERLASFEAGYLRDPTGTVAALVDDLDLPPEQKARIRESLGASSADDTPPGPGGATVDANGQSSLSPEDRELLNWARQERERTESERESTARNAQLDTVVNHWKGLDTTDKIDSPPDHRVLAFISAAAARGGYKSLNELAETARADWLDERDRLLGGAVQNGRREGNPPPALPGSGALPAPQVRPRDLKEANKLVLAAVERGELPGLGG